MVTYIADVQYEHGISEAFDNTKVIFKELEGFNHNGNIVALLNNEAKKQQISVLCPKYFIKYYRPA